MTHEFSLVPALMLGALVSQAISRKMNKENFYDALLTDDGHQIEHVRPPRDLQSWHQLPVSAIANFKPVVLSGLNREQIQEILKRPYSRFPVLKESKICGILTRKEAEAALAANREPQMESATLCQPNQSIRHLHTLLIESPTQFVVLSDEADEKVLGVVTLHDLLRAEVQKASTGGE
jgi:CIC family chloride channel protein